MALAPCFSPLTYDDLPGWVEDDHGQAFGAFRRSAERVLEKSYRSGSLGVEAQCFDTVYAKARSAENLSAKEARSFFERHFVPCHVHPEAGPKGFVTGYYEPEVGASLVRTETFRYPLLARPLDLADVDNANRPETLDPSFAFARQTPNGLAEHSDRQAIECGALDGHGLEIAWLKDPVDVFFIHVQGSARLNLPDGRVIRVTYAAKSGHPFTGPGGLLVSMGEISATEVSMQTIRAWFAKNPGRVDEILWQNRSFIFFRETMVDDPALGPVAAAKVPLTPGRSLAVDRLLHTFGTPFFIDAPDVEGFGPGPFRRLMIAQDTGSAIVGQARGDLFAGSGSEAGEIAGVIKADATFYALVPATLLKLGGGTLGR